MWPLLFWDSVADIVLGALLAVVFLGPVMPEMPSDQHPAKTQTVDKFDTFTDNGGAEYRVSAKITGNNRFWCGPMSMAMGRSCSSPTAARLIPGST